MSAVLLALFDDYAAADRVRMALFEDGFPTDRIEVTAHCEPGRAALQASDSAHSRFLRYFRALLTGDDERHYAEQFAKRLGDGAAAVTVHPRGPVETSRATEILMHGGPAAVAKHDLTHQAFEHAAARQAKPWVSHFWIPSSSSSHCIYCRLFEHD